MRYKSIVLEGDIASTMIEYTCIKCATSLNDENWTQAYQKSCHYVCKLCDNNRRTLARAALKQEVIDVYGSKCLCCNCNIIDFLTIDHIDESGAEHRKKLSKNGSRSFSSFYQWLKKNNYPQENYQVLCFNCNYAKHICGICPHQVKSGT